MTQYYKNKIQDEITKLKSIHKVSEEAKKQREEIAKESGAFATLISRLKTTNANTKEREELIKKINSQYGTTLKNIKDERDFQEQLNKELASYLEYQKAKYALQKNEDLIVRNLAKQDEITKKLAKEQSFLNLMQSDYQKLLQRPEALVPQSVINSLDEQQRKVNKINKELQDAEKRFENYGSAANKAAIKVDILTKSGTKYVEQVKKDEPEVTKVVKKEKEEQSYIRRDSASTVISDIVSEGTKRLQAEKSISDKSREQLKTSLAEQTALRERNLKFVIESMTQILSITQDLATMSENKYKEINDKVLANENLTTEQKQKAIIKNNANAKKAFELNKKFQIASTLISTFATARDAYKSQFLPPSPPLGTAVP